MIDQLGFGWVDLQPGSIDGFDMNLFWDSSDAIAAILKLHFPAGSILDVNYGRGVFYRKVDRDVLGMDLKKPTGDLIGDAGLVPFNDDSFDVGICDPPYTRGKHDPKYIDQYGEGPSTFKKCTDLYFSLLPELVRVARAGIVIKSQDSTDGHRFYSRQFILMNFMKELTGLDVHDAGYLIKKGVADNLVRGRRHFFAQGMSFFLVYRWRQKNPFKPVRF